MKCTPSPVIQPCYKITYGFKYLGSYAYCFHFLSHPGIFLSNTGLFTEEETVKTTANYDNFKGLIRSSFKFVSKSFDYLFNKLAEKEKVY